MRRVADVVDQTGHIALVIQALCQHHLDAVRRNGRFLDGFQNRPFPVVLQILYKEHGVIALFLRLYPVPVPEPVQSLIVTEIGKIQVQVRGIKFLVHLLI